MTPNPFPWILWPGPFVAWDRDQDSRQVFFKALTQEEQGPFTQDCVPCNPSHPSRLLCVQDFLAKLLITLHWWGDVDISSPLAVLPDGFRAGASGAAKPTRRVSTFLPQEALEKLLHSEEGLFVSHPSSPSWLANMPPHSKECRALLFLDLSLCFYLNEDELSILNICCFHGSFRSYPA